MEIEGLDYNTQRAQLRLPEYGRDVQQMVAYCKTIADREERQICAEEIVATMSRLIPQKRKSAETLQKLWDHLALLSNFELDIDWPFDIEQAQQQFTKPNPVMYNSVPVDVRHYGKMLLNTIEKLKEMESGSERDELTRLVANQMKRNLVTFGQGSLTDERVASDLERLTDGRIQLDFSSFEFEPVQVVSSIKNKKKKR